MAGFSVFSFVFSAVVLFYVLKYHIHIHVSYTAAPGRAASARRGQREAAPPVSAQSRQRGITSQRLGGGVAGTPLVSQRDLESALTNLGAPKARARIAAQRAMMHQDTDVERALRRAIDYERTAA